ncbi:MAG: alpha/beta hydrolase [Flavisolibacter sp.]
MEEIHLFENTVYDGASLSSATRAIVIVHGRGDPSDKMLVLSKEIVKDPLMAVVFPKATNNTWYPKSFLAPLEENQPWLDSALENLHKVITHIKANGISEENIFLFGFSQGACLSFEYACRHATRYSGIIILSGGLIGPAIDKSNYTGNFTGTSIFMGCSDNDSHIPLQRLHESKSVALQMGAEVDLEVYPGMGHLISGHEINKVRSMIA